MADQTETVAADFEENLSRLTGSVERLEGVLSRVFQALSQHGVRLSVDVTGLVREVRRDLNLVHQISQRAVAQLEQMQGLVHTSAVITSSLELDQVLDEVIDTIIELTGAERAYLMLSEGERGELTIRAARNWDRESLSEDEIVFSRGVVSRTLVQGEPTLSTNAQHDTRFQAMDSVFSYGLRSVLCIPLIVRGRTLGALYADNRIAQGIFNEDIVPLLTAFANQAAIAIDNARLFEQVKADLDEAQREVRRLRIQVDQKEVTARAGEIAESEYFQQLAAMARQMREAPDDSDE